MKFRGVTKRRTDRLIKISGIIHKSSFPEETKNPVILSHQNKLVDLLIQEVHEKQIHAESNQKLTALQQAFRIIQRRSVVKKAINQCRVCQHFKTTALVQKMAPLSEERTVSTPPFAHVGIGFLGPL